MPDVSQPVHEVDVRWDVRIPARDGIQLSANVWLSRPRPGSPAERFPVILEMIPYGKDSWRRNTDTARGEWLAARGFALCRLDVRGTGSSEGVALDEYTDAETLDGYDAVEWLASQAWCNGNVGMWGISYGGFTSIQVAKLRPPHLRAILPMYATDDRYRDDVHIRGGCVTASEKCQYAVSQLGMNAMPPHPPFRGPGWKAEWLARLEATPPWLFPWIREQLDGPYWRRGSLAPDYDALECAVFQVAGWSDAYVDAAFRIQERCRNAVSVRTLVGNWVHAYPDDAYPGPNLDWLHELVRFFDRYLKGVENGWEDEPALVWFEREYADPEPFPVEWPGRWRAADRFPVPGNMPFELELGEEEDDWSTGGRRLVLRPVDPDQRSMAASRTEWIAHRATAGTSGALSWGAGSPPNGLARDLRPDELKGLAFTTDDIDNDLEILGVPEAVLHLSSDSMPIATCVVRLSEVDGESGTSSLVATGVLNVTHRASDANPAPLAQQPSEVRIPLRTSGYRFKTGNRIRLTILTSYWPVLWPSPIPGHLRVHHGPAYPSRLVLPCVTHDFVDATIPAFRTDPVVMREVGTSEEDGSEWRIEDDVLHGTVTVSIFEGGASTQEDGSRLYSSEHLVLTASDPDPAHASLDSDVVYRWSGFGSEADIRATGRIASDADAFDVSVALDVRLDGEPFFAREWQERIPRRLV